MYNDAGVKETQHDNIFGPVVVVIVW